MHVSNAELRREIRNYQAAIRHNASRRARHVPTSSRRCKPRGTKASEELGRMILSIAVHLSEKACFRSYTFKEDFISDAALLMLKACAKFDLSRTTDGRPSSAFSFLTQCCWFEFVRVIQKEARRGIRGGAELPLEVLALPHDLRFGAFDAHSLATALRPLQGHQPPP